MQLDFPTINSPTMGGLRSYTKTLQVNMNPHITNHPSDYLQREITNIVQASRERVMQNRKDEQRANIKSSHIRGIHKSVLNDSPTNKIVVHPQNRTQENFTHSIHSRLKSNVGSDMSDSKTTEMKHSFYMESKEPVSYNMTNPPQLILDQTISS